MLGTISAATFSTTPPAQDGAPANGSARSNRTPPPATPSGESQQKQSDPRPAPPARTEQAPPPPAASATPAPSTATLAASAVPSTDLVPVEESVPAVANDGLADKRAALARITETAQGWNEVSTVLDGAAEFSARAAEESSEAPAPRDSAARTEDRARTFAAEEGYSASKTVFEGAAPEGDTAKAA